MNLHIHDIIKLINRNLSSKQGRRIMDKKALYITTDDFTNEYKNNEKNYCVLSLIDLTKIAPDGDRRNAIIKKAQGVLRDNLQDARKMWNSIKSKGKFVFRDGQYTTK